MWAPNDVLLVIEGAVGVIFPIIISIQLEVVDMIGIVIDIFDLIWFWLINIIIIDVVVQTSDTDHCGCNCTKILPQYTNYTVHKQACMRKSGLELKSGLVLFVVVIIVVIRNSRKMTVKSIGRTTKLREKLIFVVMVAILIVRIYFTVVDYEIYKLRFELLLFELKLLVQQL